MNLTATFAAVKILGWWHDVVSLTLLAASPVPPSVTGVPIPEESVVKVDAAYEELLLAMASHGKRGDRAREHMQRRKVDPRTLEEALNAASRQESIMEAYQGEKPECVHCGKRHGGDVCWLKSGRCLKCGSNKECPNLKELVPRDVPATATTELATPAKEDENYILFPEMASTMPP
ncbi:hypothetical protein Taro_002075 [Colocasia esculenta]|uniref:Uncharacterized protein n=1 Tax=Colocasia esculenta TaxID=4460 RepID=A0A843TML3_COLES|nr:hypothetical protein [Colocasia esculenta]